MAGKPGRSGGPGRGQGRLLNPAATLRRVEALARTLSGKPAQLREWTSAEIVAVLGALRRAAYPFELESERRAEALLEAEDE